MLSISHTHRPVNQPSYSTATQFYAIEIIDNDYAFTQIMLNPQDKYQNDA